MVSGSSKQARGTMANKTSGSVTKLNDRNYGTRKFHTNIASVTDEMRTAMIDGTEDHGTRTGRRMRMHSRSRT